MSSAVSIVRRNLTFFSSGNTRVLTVSSLRNEYLQPYQRLLYYFGSDPEPLIDNAFYSLPHDFGGLFFGLRIEKPTPCSHRCHKVVLYGLTDGLRPPNDSIFISVTGLGRN